MLNLSVGDCVGNTGNTDMGLKSDMKIDLRSMI